MISMRNRMGAKFMIECASPKALCLIVEYHLFTKQIGVTENAWGCSYFVGRLDTYLNLTSFIVDV